MATFPVRRPRALAAIAIAICLVILWTALALTPSSYALVLKGIDARETGLIAGSPRAIRSDEWAVWTPYFQAAVRDNFERFNRTSFYNEDLRNVNALPLRDWGLIFKPQFWAFFWLPPANALGCFYGILMAAFLTGYFFLFRELGLDSTYAAAGSLLLFASGISQFWWTTFAPCLAFAPWVALVFLGRFAWYLRLPLFAYAVAWWTIALPYPVLLASCGLAVVVLTVALRPETLRPDARLAAAAGGLVLAAGLVYCYFADEIPVMMHSAYPGHRHESPGAITLATMFTQFWPALNFSSNYRNFEPPNLCETAVVGSFLPALTICVLDYARFRKFFVGAEFRSFRRAFAILAFAALVVAFWMAGPCPAWVGLLLYFDHGDAGRQAFLLGLVTLTAGLMIWKSGMVTVAPLRAMAFVILGPVAAAVVKRILFAVPLREMAVDGACIAIAAAAALATIGLDRARAARLMLGTVVVLNAVVYLRFNPLQSADAIFDTPDSEVLEKLEKTQSETPGAYLAVVGYPGATLNGLGLRSVSHVLVAPKPDFFRPYFPQMNADEFNTLFNRFEHVQLEETAIPYNAERDTVNVPIEVFRPIRNLRRVVIETGLPSCAGQTGGAVAMESGAGSDLVLTGWAPWAGESSEQALHIWTKRPLVVQSLTTVRRPDIAESLSNYRLEKAGFRLAISSSDRQPLSLNDLHIMADSTLDGQTPLYGCGH